MDITEVPAIAPTVSLDDATADLVRMGAEALIEKGRDEVRAEWQASIVAEQYLEEVKRPIEFDGRVKSATLMWFLREALRRVFWGRDGTAYTACSESAFACAIANLSPSQVAELKDIVTRMARAK